MNISKHFTKSGAGNMTQVGVGHGLDYLTRTVRVTLHRVDKHIAHLSMSPQEALDLGATLIELAKRMEDETVAYPPTVVRVEPKCTCLGMPGTNDCKVHS